MFVLLFTQNTSVMYIYIYVMYPKVNTGVNIYILHFL